MTESVSEAGAYPRELPRDRGQKPKPGAWRHVEGRIRTIHSRFLLLREHSSSQTPHSATDGCYRILPPVLTDITIFISAAATSRSS